LLYSSSSFFFARLTNISGAHCQMFDADCTLSSEDCDLSPADCALFDEDYHGFHLSRR